jgi:hypothetical protein
MEMKMTEAEQLMLLEADIDDLMGEIAFLRDKVARKESLLADTKQRRNAIREALSFAGP